jgi:hypothetical protein
LPSFLIEYILLDALLENWQASGTIFTKGVNMTRSTTVDEQLISQIAADVLLVQRALGSAKLPYLLMVDIAEHTTNKRPKALDLIGRGKQDGLWSELDSPSMGTKPLVLSERLTELGAGTKPSLSPDALIEILERHDLAATQAFIDAWSIEWESSNSDAPQPKTSTLNKNTRRQLQVVADHLYLEQLHKGPLHSSVTTNLFGMHYPQNADGGTGYASRMKRRYNTFDYHEINGNNYWFVTEDGKELIAKHGIVREIDEARARALLHESLEPQQSLTDTILMQVAERTKKRQESVQLSLGTQISGLTNEIEDLRSLIAQLERQVDQRTHIKNALETAQTQILNTDTKI